MKDYSDMTKEELEEEFEKETNYLEKLNNDKLNIHNKITTQKEKIYIIHGTILNKEIQSKTEEELIFLHKYHLAINTNDIHYILIAIENELTYRGSQYYLEYLKNREKQK